MRVLRFVLVLPLIFALGGCFVFDELDWGMAELEKHPIKPKVALERRANRNAQPETPPASASDSFWDEKLPDLRAWWKGARTLSSSKNDESIVQCRLDGRDQFMRIHECQTRGGQVGS
ncbi:MAG: hypothetical protein JRH01_00130 [Deltaproteobacteria bacterium]|nr:hypothetical protein [Deltaproteobacteria bacterium]MBW2392805.1 hypothetical protein [Deltaproteobacteria bacterium]